MLPSSLHTKDLRLNQIKMPEKMNSETLLPDRHPNADFFVCDVLEAIPKDDMGSMEHPMFSLSKKPDLRVKTYDHRGNTLTITPSVLGRATIYDKDILIYCISQIVAKMNAKLSINRKVRLTAYDLLVATNRVTSGRGYSLLEKAFERLVGTRIKTDIKSGDIRIREGFGLIDSWKIIEKSPNDARMVAVEVTLSEWLFAAVKAGEVLTIDRDYFRLGKPIERRLYELARKHCGRQKRWRVNLDTLRTKSGTNSPIRRFRQLVRELAKSNHLPGYRVVVSKDGVLVTFYNRQSKGRMLQVKDLLAEMHD
jgi:plasmid replication initiation protein